MMWSYRFVRFLVGGAANTAISYAIFIVLSLVLPAAVAYTISFALGIAISYYINSRLVFASSSKSAAAAFPLVYGFQYVIGIVILTLSIEVGALPEWLAMAFVLAVNVPVTFLLMQFIFVPRHRGR